MKKRPGFLEARQGDRYSLPLDYDKVAQDIHGFFVSYYTKKNPFS